MFSQQAQQLDNSDAGVIFDSQYDFLLRMFRNKFIPTDFTSSIVDKLGSVLIEYVKNPNFLNYQAQLTILIQKSLQANANANENKNKIKNEFSFPGQISHEIRDIIPIALGLIRRQADSAFLSNTKVKNFYSFVRIRKVSRDRNRKSILYPLGDSRSSQRSRIRCFFNLTSFEFDSQICPNIANLFPEFHELQNIIYPNLSRFLLTHSPVLPNIVPKTNTKPDDLLCIKDIKFNDTYYVNNKVFFSLLGKVRNFFSVELPKTASFSFSYPLTNPNRDTFKSILDFTIATLQTVPLQQLGNIPVIHRSLFEISSNNRNTSEGFEFVLSKKDYTTLYHQTLYDTTSTTPTYLDRISLNFRPFSDGSVNYTLEFKNWFNKKINTLKTQINNLSTYPDAVKDYLITQVSPDTTEQRNFSRTMKIREHDFYVAHNKALISYLLRNKIGDENHYKNIQYFKTKQKSKDKKSFNAFDLNYGPWSFDVQLPDATELQNIYTVNNIAPGDDLSLNARNMKRLLSIINTIYVNTIQTEGLVLDEKLTKNEIDNRPLKEYYTGLSKRVFAERDTREWFKNYFNTLESHPDFLSHDLRNYLSEYFRLTLWQAYNEPENLSKSVPVPQGNISFDIFKTYFAKILDQYFLVFLAQKIAPLKEINFQNHHNPIVLDEKFIIELMNNLPEQFMKIIIGEFIISNHLSDQDREKLFTSEYQFSYLILNNIFKTRDAHDSKYNSSSITLLADERLGSSKVFLKITFPVPPVKKVPSDSFHSIMGIDLGHRTFASLAIRSYGVGIDTHRNINPEDVVRSTIFRAPDQGLAKAVKHGDRSRSLNAQTRFIQRSRHKFSLSLSVDPINQSFDSQDQDFFHLFKLSRNISSVQSKKRSINQSVVHKTGIDILHLGIAYHVNKFIFEDLSGLFKYYQSLGGKRQTSYYFSSSLFGQLISSIRYKSLRFGYTDSKSGYVFENLPDYTSQLCPFSIAENNKFLPDSKVSRKDLNLHRFCKNGNVIEDQFIPDKKGEIFLHNPLHDPHNPQRLFLFNRDFVGAFNLTYTL